ncbi:MAG: type II toxin-antitoxin system Phd/YefM family antitoxin [Firmicutes bacterium]|jgi:prevent-host-death family protein|nr:type II toxin-antitoxin system Phd/YefM family antitoxin [Bacillota bacterium]
MPSIRPSSDLRNNYNDISKFCHEHSEPVFITKNGRGDLVIMSIETYEMLVGKLELYRLIDAGLDDIKNHRVMPIKEVFEEIERRLPE